jgi:alpha-L-rhamnosidase
MSRNCWAALMLLAAESLRGGERPDALAQGFANPPQEARPAVSLEVGDTATRDAQLKWLHEIGVGAINLGEIDLGSFRHVGARPPYRSHQWWQETIGAITKADQLGMKTTILSSPGWSHSGGPSVKPEQAMKKLVWSATVVEGGTPFRDRLEEPPNASGPFQDLPVEPHPLFGDPHPAKLYRDVLVLAYPSPPSTIAPVRISSSAGPLDGALLFDGKLTSSLPLPPDADGGAWIQFEYEHPQVIRSAIFASRERSVVADLEAMEPDGIFHSIGRFELFFQNQSTASFAPVESRSFRFRFSRGAPKLASLAAPEPLPGMEWTSVANPSGPKPAFQISELTLEPHGRVHAFESKAGFFNYVEDFDALVTPPATADYAVDPKNVIDLTKRMNKDGILTWTPPPGRWTVLRLGYSLTGKLNHPAPPEARGLEVDKLDRAHVRDYIDNYLKESTGPLAPALVGQRGITALFTDSIESMSQNWTEQMLAQFKSRRGYDARPYLPALTGVIVGSAETSDRFLWDFRRTIAELVHENLYREISERAHAFGLAVYGQALEYGRPQLGDDMQMRRYADVPLGAMWAPLPASNQPYPNFVADIRGAASVAHLYGRKRVGAESFTSTLTTYSMSPRLLKPVADLELALGVNWISGASSLSKRDTWAHHARSWIEYLSRSSWLLQQGQYVADVACFYGEEAPLVALGERIADVPRNYAFDFVNAEALLGLLRAQGGDLITPSGMRYRALQLTGSSQRMTLPVLRKIRDFVQEGVIVVGQAPTDSPSLADDQAEFSRIRAELWDETGQGRRLGHGRVYSNISIDEALSVRGVLPDISYDSHDAELLSVHRRLADSDIYFVMNRRPRAETVSISFRVSGKAPEIWSAETGARSPTSYHLSNGRTIVPLKLRPYDALFVVFRKPATMPAFDVGETAQTPLQRIEGPWSISFAPDRGAPASITTDRLASWTQNPDLGIRYFSGSARYRRSLDTSPSWFAAGARLKLDLGTVGEIAALRVNGIAVGTLWNPPYIFDVTDALRPGQNELDIEVANTWVNRLIGDKQPGSTPIAPKFGITESKLATYRADAPLEPSGLIGPVTLLRDSAPP